MSRLGSSKDAVRRSSRRIAASAATRYRDAVLEQSSWLPAYLTAVDAADVTLRAVRAARRRPVVAGAWDEPDPDTAAVLRAGLSATAELSLVLTGTPRWRRSVGGVALASGDDRVAIEGGLVEHVAEHVQLCVPLPLDQLASGRWRVLLLDHDGVALPAPPHPDGWCQVLDSGRRNLSGDTDRGIWLAVDGGGGLEVVRGSDGPSTVEHRVSPGIARLTVEWTPPPGTPDELLLLDDAGTVVRRITGVAATGAFALSAVLDTAPTEEHGVLTVAVPGAGAPEPLALAPGWYPLLFTAPALGTVRLGGTRVGAFYDRANRLQLRITT